MSPLVCIDLQQCSSGIVHESLRWETIAGRLAKMGLPVAISGFYLDGVNERMKSVSEVILKDWLSEIARRLDPIAFLCSATTALEWSWLCKLGPEIKRSFPLANLWVWGPYALDLSQGIIWQRLNEQNPFFHLVSIYSNLIEHPRQDPGIEFSRELISTFGPDHVLGATWTSDGCPSQCSFCLPTNFTNKKRRAWSSRAVADYHHEIAVRLAAGYRFIRLVDLNVTGGGVDYFLKLCRGLLESFPDIQFWCDGMAEILLSAKPNQLAGLPRFGWTIQLGIESFDSVSRMRLNRPRLPHDVRHRLRSLPVDTAIQL